MGKSPSRPSMHCYLLSACLILQVIIPVTLQAQRIELLHARPGVSLRALSVVSDKVIWVSGSSGSVGKSTDGGKTWKWITVAGHESRDFRDIEAFDASTAIIIAIADPALILKTINGGITWKIVYENKDKRMFLDAIEFWNPQSGIVVGDPVEGNFFIARTFDGGDSWTALPQKLLPAADSGEACFASSGTVVRALDRDEACFVSGGSRSRFFWKGAPSKLPLQQGWESQGANSVAVWFKRKKVPQVVVVGGDYKAEAAREHNCAISRDGGVTWILPSNPPLGYRSCVEYINERTLITCGPNGVDISLDKGINWNSVSQTGFHVCRKSKKGSSVFLAGKNGRIGKLVW